LEMRLLEDADIPIIKHEMLVNPGGFNRPLNPSEIQ